MAKLFAISDIHGHLDEFISALSKVDLSDKNNRLILIGDYIDNGLQSFQVISKIIELEELYPNQIITLLGNHEDMFNLAIKEARYGNNISVGQDHYFRNSGLTTLHSFYPEATVETRGIYFKKFATEHKHLRKWIKNLPTRYENSDYYFVHAGVDFTKNFWNQTHRDMIWIREPFLSSNVKYNKIVFHGHSPVKEEPYYEEKSNRINIDEGCVYGGKLNIVVIEEGNIPLQQSTIIKKDIYEK